LIRGGTGSAIDVGATPRSPTTLTSAAVDGRGLIIGFGLRTPGLSYPEQALYGVGGSLVGGENAADLFDIIRRIRQLLHLLDYLPSRKREPMAGDGMMWQ
jgi:hypothetical protein